MTTNKQREALVYLLGIADAAKAIISDDRAFRAFADLVLGTCERALADESDAG